MVDQVAGGSAALMIYTRGDGFVKDASDVYGQVGTLEILGRLYETVERVGRVSLTGGRTYICKLETSNNHNVKGADGRSRPRKQIRPVNHGKLVRKDNSLVSAAILIHPGSKPSDLEGCIAPGFVVGQKLTLSTESTEIIWDLCGGANGKECQLKVVGDMKLVKELKPYQGL